MTAEQASYGEILRVLAQNRVRFILIGGLAGVAQGSSRATFDVDVVYARDPEDMAHLAATLAAYQPYLRGVPAGLPFRWDEPTIRSGLNFTLTTSLGALDLLGEVVGGGGYHQLLPFTEEVVVFGVACRCVTLDKLIQLKRAAGRPKDIEAVAELQALLDERRRMDSFT